MKSLTKYIVEKLVLNSNSKIRKKPEYKYHPKTREELEHLIERLILDAAGNNILNQNHYKINLNDIDVSEITNMAGLFMNSSFDGDISEWDVSNVEDMSVMFNFSKFNGDLSKWDVSKVKHMGYMFSGSKFTGENGDISKWNVSNVERMEGMFAKTEFNGDISKWNVSNVKHMKDIFKRCPIIKKFRPKFKK